MERLKLKEVIDREVERIESMCAFEDLDNYDETRCIECSKKKTVSELEAGHDFCWDCYMEHQG